MTGIDFETFLYNLFKEMGYKVRRTPITGDQGADLIISKDGTDLAVQAKRSLGKVGNKAVQEVVASIKFYKCSGGMIVTNSTYTKSAINLAKSNEIELIDSKSLKKLLSNYSN